MTNVFWILRREAILVAGGTVCFQGNDDDDVVVDDVNDGVDDHVDDNDDHVDDDPADDLDVYIDVDEVDDVVDDMKVIWQHKQAVQPYARVEPRSLL